MADLPEMFRREGIRGFENGKRTGIDKAHYAFCREIHKHCPECSKKESHPYCERCEEIELKAMQRLAEVLVR